MATIKDTIKIDGYDQMTAEQKLAALEAAEFDTSKYVDKSLYDRKVSELAEKNKRVKDLEASQLTEEQRFQQDRKAFEEERKKFNRERNAANIQRAFSEAELKPEEYAELDIYSFDDAELADKFAKGIVKMVKAARTAAELQARNALVGSASAPASGATPDQASKMRTDYASAVQKGDTMAMARLIREAQEKKVSLT